MDDLDVFSLREAGVTEEELSPHPDVHALFVHYNRLYFDDTLGPCSLEWSKGAMTSCAGICYSSKRGGGCTIRLSQQLLKFRTPEDIKDVLLHEMIHAWVSVNDLPGAGKDGHGSTFVAKMRSINASQVPDIHRPARGYNVTVRHSFVAEVAHYLTHWWKCDKCGHEVKRARNRPPQEADCRGRSKSTRGDACKDERCRYHTHVKRCGGKYIKTREPEPDPKAKKKAQQKRKSGGSGKAAKASRGRSSRSGKAKFPGIALFAVDTDRTESDEDDDIDDAPAGNAWPGIPVFPRDLFIEAGQRAGGLSFGGPAFGAGSGGESEFDYPDSPGAPATPALGSALRRLKREEPEPPASKRRRLLSLLPPPLPGGNSASSPAAASSAAARPAAPRLDRGNDDVICIDDDDEDDAAPLASNAASAPGHFGRSSAAPAPVRMRPERSGDPVADRRRAACAAAALRRLAFEAL